MDRIEPGEEFSRFWSEIFDSLVLDEHDQVVRPVRATCPRCATEGPVVPAVDPAAVLFAECGHVLELPGARERPASTPVYDPDMSNARSDNAPSAFGAIGTVGWIGEHPVTGAELPFLLAFNAGDGLLGPAEGQAATAALLEEMGIRPGLVLDHPTLLGSGPVTARITRSGSTPRVEVDVIPGFSMARDVVQEWADLAVDNKTIVLLFTTRLWPEGLTADMSAIDQFRNDRLTVDSSAVLIVPVS
ncbi:DUF5949 family protein [Kitasatospora kifunensis]|uniref:Uncharacterized protein n=1 Tax=Kitasatospora kifunensis TaxID=58351 RepID=A0A7W7RCK1_KITKI|nr:DUF5949 family protein [Kitasatospora kifunensis]MBB4929108.1 hypothetical protein [Kitasatospora kifunensis]